MTYSKEYIQEVRDYINSLLSGDGQSKIKELSSMGGAGDIDAHTAEKILHETMEKYKSERKKYMSNKDNLGK